MNTELINNVANIQVSDKTKELIECRAMLNMIFKKVDNYIDKTYKCDIEDILPNFVDDYVNFDTQLLNAISNSIELTSLDSDYTQI